MDPRDVAWTNAQWKTSSFSGNGANCLEYAALQVEAQVGIRDSKAPPTGLLVFSAATWRRFAVSVAR